MELELLEQFVQECIGIPNVNFNNLDISIAKEFVEALIIVTQKYPALEKAICSIGDFGDISDQKNMVINSNKWKKIKWSPMHAYGSTMAALKIPVSYNWPTLFEGLLAVFQVVSPEIPVIKNINFIEKNMFIAIAYDALLKYNNIDQINLRLEDNAQKGYHPKHCINFKSFVFHEIGHILDHILGFENDIKFCEMVKLKSNNLKTINSDISKRADKGMQELIAEAFSEYMMCPDSNELISSIGRYIDEKYKKYENSQLFNINYRYKNHLESKINAIKI